MDFYPQILIKFPSNKFHEILCSGSRAVMCGGTDRWADDRQRGGRTDVTELKGEFREQCELA